MTPQDLVTAVSLIGMLFSIFLYFRNPQVKLDKKQAIDKMDNDGKTQLMEHKIQWEKETTEKRFIEMGNDFRGAMTLAQNHIHTVDTKVDQLITANNSWHIEMNTQMVRLQTIMEERLPVKRK